MTKITDKELDAMLDLAADTPTRVEPALMARVMVDADAVLDLRTAELRGTRETGPGLFRSLVTMVGGWTAVGGLVSATLAGVWIGFAPPAAFSTTANSYLGLQQSYDLGDMIASVSLVGE